MIFGLSSGAALATVVGVLNDSLEAISSLLRSFSGL